MKKALIGVASVLALLLLVVFVGGFFLDADVAIGVEQRLAAPPAKVFGHLDNVPGLTAWWTAAPIPDLPPMTIAHEQGPERGAGLVATFAADGQTLETWTVKAAEPPRRIVYDVDFAGMFTVERTLTLTPDGAGTHVAWRDTARLESPAMRWMTVLMPPESVEKNFVQALGLLDKAARR